MRAGSQLAFSLLLPALASCGPPDRFPLIVPPDAIASSGSAPRVTFLQDLGIGSLEGVTRIPSGTGDGTATIGELVHVSGDDFGRQVRVTVAGQPAELVARTAEGGLVIRIPWGTRTGTQRIEVINSHGKGGFPIVVTRFALGSVPSRDELHVLELSGSTVRPLRGPPIRIPNASSIRYAGDGRIAYIAGIDTGGGLAVSVVEMVGRGGPRLLSSLPIPGGSWVSLTASEHAPRAAAISDTHVVLIDTKVPQHPEARPFVLPDPWREDLVDAEIDPDGKLLAVLQSRGNRIGLFSLSSSDRLTLLGSVQVLPKVNAPLVWAMQFSSDGHTLWVVSGDNERSIAGGNHPLRLTAIRIDFEEKGSSRRFGILSVWQTLELPHRAAPVGLVVTRGQPLATGETVSVPPKNSAVFLTVEDSKLLQLANTRLDRKDGLKKAVKILEGLPVLGTVVRSDIAGKGGPMFSTKTLYGAIDVTSDAQLLLVSGVQVETQSKPASVKLVYGISTRRVFGTASPVFLPLARVDPEALARPFLLGDVRIQP
jgi:hypothetical protein